MYKAMYYKKEDTMVKCLLCPRGCLISEGYVGLCGARKVVDGELVSTNYGILTAIQWDPMEKKPLYHFYPGTEILSLGTYGCNLFCSFCQNWCLARSKRQSKSKLYTPGDILEMLEIRGGPDKSLGVAFTYNEPFVWYEFVYNTARLLNKKGYRNVLVTNGYINSEPLLDILPYIDAMNIDVKGFSDSFYHQHCQGLRKPIMETVEIAIQACHVEVTCLLIPSLNDSAEESRDLSAWLSSLSSDLVLHYSRYFPQYKLSLPPTSIDKMIELRAIAREKLRYVYLGNTEIPGAGDTRCPYCDNLLISRFGYKVQIIGLEGVTCNKCKNKTSLILS